LRAGKSRLAPLIIELGHRGEDRDTYWRMRIADALPQEVDPELTDFADQEPEQQIAVVVGIPAHVRAEEVPQHPLDDPSRGHCLPLPSDKAQRRGPGLPLCPGSPSCPPPAAAPCPPRSLTAASPLQRLSPVTRHHQGVR